MDKITIGEKTYLSVKAYAKYKAISLPTVYNRIREKAVTTRRVLGVIFIEI